VIAPQRCTMSVIQCLAEAVREDAILKTDENPHGI
jgi:hypothetical protein